MYEFLDQFGKEFEVELDLVDMRNLSHSQWVIPLRNYAGEDFEKLLITLKFHAIQVISDG